MAGTSTHRFLVFFVEELSMKAFLEAWLDQFDLGSEDFNVVVVSGKDHLLRSLKGKLSGYQSNACYEFRIIIIVDRDDDDCKTLNKKVEEICSSAGFIPRQGSTDWNCATCIVIQELESWYFSEWNAVIREFPKVSGKIPGKAAFRNSERIVDPYERISEIIAKKRYSRLPKPELAATIARHIDVESSTSPSFKHLHQVVYEALVR